MRAALVPILLIGAPILEIAVLILVGQRIGVLPTLAIVVLSAVLGAVLLKRQGFAALGRIQAEARAGRVPGRDLVQGAMILLAGMLLLLPGLVGDAIGLLLFLPPVRDLLWRGLARSVTATLASTAGRRFRAPAPRRPAGAPEQGPRRPSVVDLSGEDFRRRGDPNSPWSPEGEDDAEPPRTLH